MAYKETPKNIFPIPKQNIFSIPKETIKFLEDLGCDVSGKVQNNLIKAQYDFVILDFETGLQNWY
jgi:hypothetical protein